MIGVMKKYFAASSAWTRLNARNSRAIDRTRGRATAGAPASCQNRTASTTRALDAVGDRWTLLIVRELLILGPSRYSDLRNGLPGIATNMLADRSREMESIGLVKRIEPSPPVATPLFRLTDRGQELKPVISALGAWARPTLDSRRRGEDFRSHWLALPLGLHLVDRCPAENAIIDRDQDGRWFVVDRGRRRRFASGPALRRIRTPSFPDHPTSCSPHCWGASR